MSRRDPALTAKVVDLSRSYLRDLVPDRVGRAALAGQASALGAATQTDLFR